MNGYSRVQCEGWNEVRFGIGTEHVDCVSYEAQIERARRRA